MFGSLPKNAVIKTSSDFRSNVNSRTRAGSGSGRGRSSTVSRSIAANNIFDNATSAMATWRP
jgi:hypothetical protein